VYAMIRLLQTRHVLSFAIAFYLSFLLLINNFVFDIGATMGERLIFHSSVGFCIALAYGLVKGYERIRTPLAAKVALGSLMAILVGFSAVATVTRNTAWKNDKTLFMTDLKTVPNSVLVNANVAASYISMADMEKDTAVKNQDMHAALQCLDKALGLHPRFVAAHLNRALVFLKLDDIDSCRIDLDSVRSIYPSYPTLHNMYSMLADTYIKKGGVFAKAGDLPGAVQVYEQGVRAVPDNADLWYNLGGAYFTNKQFPNAIVAFNNALKLNPQYTDAARGLQAAESMVSTPGAKTQPK
jgi:protein O-mannosyl-transferase